MIAFAVMSVVFVGVMLADRAATYWTLAAQTSGAALYEARADLDDVRSAAGSDFYRVVSSVVPDRGATCLSGGPCYDIRRVVTDLSTCAKYAETRLERRLAGYPAMATSLSAYLANPSEVSALGGDCALSYPDGDWTRPAMRYQADPGGGDPTGIDVVHGVAYVTENAVPYLRIVSAGSPVVFANAFQGLGPFNAIDVARDAATGRTYAYVAAVSPQFQIVDVTDGVNPTLAGSAALNGVTATGAQTQGWRIFFYDRKVYVMTRFLSGSSPEFHTFDVGDPEHPSEIGAGFKLNTSVYGIVVRDGLLRGTVRRFAYLATTSPSGELKVLDVADPARPIIAASCDLPGDHQATSLFILGNTLYVGRDNVPGGGADLYAFDAADPTSPAFCAWLGKTDIATDRYSRHVEAVRASGPYLFVATTNTTNAHGQVQVRNADPTTNFALIATYDMPGLAENALDLDDDSLYTASTSSPQVRVLRAP